MPPRARLWRTRPCQWRCSMEDSALDDLRVIDFSEGLSGSYCSHLFAGAGADVIKVEPPDGDATRHAGPFPGGAFDVERSGLSLYLNINKRSIAVALESDTGREAVRELASGADLLITDRPVTELRRLGLDFEDLQSRNAQLVMTSITPYGRGGPRGSHLGNAFSVYHASGLGWETPTNQVRDPATQPPLAPGNPQADYLTGATAAAATMAALFHREAIGRGQLVDISGQEANANHLRVTLAAAAHTPETMAPRTKSNFDPLVPCKDGHVFLTPYNLDHWWQRLRQLMGNPEWAESEAFATAAERTLNCEAIEPLVHAWATGYTRADLYRLTLDSGLPCFPVYSPAELLASEQLRSRNYFEQIDHPEAGHFIQPGWPVSLSRTPMRSERSAPRLGEHTDEVLAEARAAKPRTGIGATRPAARAAAGDLPLSGVRVIDFGWILSVPHATAWLGALGAQVIRVESHLRPDTVRAAGLTRGADGIAGIERSGSFNNQNFGKLGVTVNLQDPRGVELIKQLVRQSDIVTENFAAGVLGRRGLTYDDLRRIKPDIIMLSGSPHGQTGPESRATGWGPTFLAYMGLPHITGYEGGSPSTMGGAYPDYALSVHMVFGMLTALRYRDRTGHGQYIDAAMSEITVAMTPEPILEYTMNGQVAPRCGNRDRARRCAPQGVYPAAGEDRWIAISVVDDEAWRGLRSVLGEPAWAQDPRFASLEGRLAGHDTIDRELSRWTAPRDAHEAAESLQRAGVIAVAVLSPMEVFHDEQLRERGYFVDVDHPELGVRSLAGMPGRYSELQLRYAPTPMLGQHNHQIFEGMLGLSAAEVEELQRESVLI
ncbi:MAG: CoA transferase [Chloroflexi bacterium]|nr:CoA transferase [Chloroflexota bacterium]